MGMAESLVQQDVEELRGRAGRMFERALELDPDLAPGAVLQRVCRARARRNRPGADPLQTNCWRRNSDPDVRAMIEQGIASANEQETRVAGQPAPAGPRRLPRRDDRRARHAGPGACQPGAAGCAAVRCSA